MGSTVSTSLEELRPSGELHCRVTCSYIEDETGAEKMRYGLVFERLSETLRFLPDLSGSRNNVINLMQRINRNKVSSVHIDDIIDDFLAAENC